MQYEIKSKPIVYNGVQFRSRLEAKWACFFDLVEWRWQYEPYEINGFNPDFILYCKSDAYPVKIIIVEIKPSAKIDENYKNEFCKKYANEKAHLLLLDENPFYENGYICIGSGSQFTDMDTHTMLYDLEMKCIDDFGSSYMVYDGMVNGVVERKSFISKSYPEYIELKKLWAEACNTVMFLKPINTNN